jgi:uncharacterized protein (TIGR00297 family)
MHSDVVARIFLGLLISSAIGAAAWRRASLTGSGALGAVLIGTPLFGFGGWEAGILLVAFFVSSSALSHYKEQSRSKRDAARFFDKGGRRDIGQAFANGGAAALFAVAFGFAESPLARAACQAAMLGALAAVTADTWATELGVLGRRPPVLITTLRPALPGRSGAVSLGGTLAAAAGAAFIAVLFVGARMAFGASADASLLLPAGAAVVGGLFGSLFDSLLGATLQAQFHDEQLDKPTEKSRDATGRPHRLVGGVRWMNNDLVNFLASLAGAAVTAALVVFA